jgi:hypothetical protein
MGRFEVRQVNPGGILIHKPRLSIALRGYYLHGATSAAPCRRRDPSVLDNG